MLVRLLDGKQQSDYPKGCIQLTAENKQDAFELGVLSQNLEYKRCIYVIFNEDRGTLDRVNVRIPLVDNAKIEFKGPMFLDATIKDDERGLKDV